MIIILSLFLKRLLQKDEIKNNLAKKSY